MDSTREKIFCFANVLFTSYINKRGKVYSSWNIYFFFSIRQTKENHRAWNVNRDKIVSIFNLKKKARFLAT